MRKVVTNSQVPHLWAHQSQSEARNSTGSLYFDGPTIYSYGSHFPIATHVTNARGEKAILLTTDRHSVTTSGHCSAVATSIPSSVQVFKVHLGRLDRWSGFDPSEAIKEYNDSIDEHERKGSIARKEWSRDYEVRRASELHTEALAFCAFYDLDVANVRALSADLETVKAAVNADRARKAKETKERKIELLRDNAERVELWLKGQNVQIPYGLDTLLRIKGDIVETSRGAQFPIDHAKRGLLLVKSVMERGEEWKTNGHTCHLGNYHIDRITAKGTVFAGCHEVSWQAIERIEPQLLAV